MALEFLIPMNSFSAVGMHGTRVSVLKYKHSPSQSAHLTQVLRFGLAEIIVLSVQRNSKL